MIVTLVVLPAERLVGVAETSSLLAAAGVTVTGPLVPEIVADESTAVIDCVPALSSVAVTVALPLLNDAEENAAPPTLSESVTESLKPVTTLLNWSSAVIVTPVVLPAERLVGVAETSSLLAAADVTVTGPLVAEIVADESVAVIDCVPALSSVAVTVALPPVNEMAAKLAPPRLSESVTESLKPVTTLLNWSSAVIVTPVVLPAERLPGVAETSSLLAAADVTVTGPLVAEIVAVESVAVIVCVPAESSVAVTVALPPLNDAEENAAPPKLSESVTESLKPVTTLLNWSSAVIVTPVVPPAERLVAEADTNSLLAAAGVTVTGPLVPEIVADASVAVIDCVAALSNVAVTVAMPLVNDAEENAAPPKLSESVTESLNPVTTLLNWSSAVIVTPVVPPAERLVAEADTNSLLAAAGVTVTGPLVPEIVADASLAVIDCVAALSNVAVTVAMPTLNDAAAKLAPPKLSESVTESLKPVTTLLN